MDRKELVGRGPIIFNEEVSRAWDDFRSNDEGYFFVKRNAKNPLFATAAYYQICKNPKGAVTPGRCYATPLSESYSACLESLGDQCLLYAKGSNVLWRYSDQTNLELAFPKGEDGLKTNFLTRTDWAGIDLPLKVAWLGVEELQNGNMVFETHDEGYLRIFTASGDECFGAFSPSHEPGIGKNRNFLWRVTCQPGEEIKGAVSVGYSTSGKLRTVSGSGGWEKSKEKLTIMLPW
ncbi:hypothetical protein [Aestuariispira insulae]|nr:hypothetical protein [Aestuariispira insulae]